MPRKKPKLNRKGSKEISHPQDRCQTPLYALDPVIEVLRPYIDRGAWIWEPAAGEGQIVKGLTMAGLNVFPTDLLWGQNFFDLGPIWVDALVTNPPFTVKYEWLAACYEFGKPFALLMPLETFGAAKAIKLFARYGMEMILPDQRYNYRMPNKGYAGSGAQFHSAWFTWGLGIGRQVTYVRVNRRNDDDWLPPNHADHRPVGTVRREVKPQDSRQMMITGFPG